MKLPLDNISYPVKIEIGSSTGSGFLVRFEQEIFLVTAKHVLYKPEGGLYFSKVRTSIYLFSGSTSQQVPMIKEIDLEILMKENNLRPDSNVDLVILKIGTVNDGKVDYVQGIKEIQNSTGKLIAYPMDKSRKFNDVEITNDIFILGYPVSISTSVLKQINYETPLVRKGIIAGKNSLNKTLILDCPVYGGNSGGLVLEINVTPDGLLANFHLVGIVVQFIPFIDTWQNVKFPGLINQNYQNSGYSVALPVDYIFELIEKK